MVGDARIGSVVAGYRIESLIGRGGMSVVYLAHHEGLERKAALKLLAPELAENQSFRDRFIRESRLAAGLDHPNVIPVYDAGEADGELYIAMRYVRGSDLRSLLAEHGPLEPADVVRVMDQLGAALDAAHQEGLVHRDVKPANVLLSPATPPAKVGHLYLADFGLTKKSLSGSGITKSGQFVGTIDYVAPEQIRSEPVDVRTDVYSLGCLLYECLTGEPPFPRETEVAVMFSHLNDPPPKPTVARSGLPAAIDAVVAKAMAKEPAERYTSAGELALAARGALRPQLARGRQTEAAPETADVRPAPAPSRRRRPVLLGAGAVALVAVIALVAALAGGGGSPGTHTSLPPASAPGSPTSTSSAPVGAALPPGFQGIAKLDPRTGRVVASFPLTLNQMPAPLGAVVPRPMLAAEGAIWLDGGSFSETLVVKVDPATGQTKDTLPLRGTGVQSMAFASGQSSFWVITSAGILGHGDDTVYRVDPGSDDVLATIPVGRTGEGVVVGPADAWAVTSAGDLDEIDTASNSIGRTIPLASTTAGVALAGGFVWVSDPVNGVVYRVDPETEKVRTIHLPGGADAIAADARGVWVMDRASGTVVPINPSSGQPGQQVRVGTEPTSIAVGGGAVWVTSPSEGTVWRVDESSLHPESFSIGGDPGPGWVSFGEGGVWVAVG